MIDRWLGNLEVKSVRYWPQYSLAIRSRRNHRVTEDKQFLEVFDRLQKQRALIQSMSEAYNLWRLCAQSSKVPGDVAELGVYRGGTALLLGLTKGERQLHLFDTFGAHGGMPRVRPEIDRHKAGDFKEAQFEDVKRLLSEVPATHFYPGFFPDSTESVPSGMRFSFVHLDVDIYQSTLDGLRYFYPRLSGGGMLVSHDYQFRQCPGVKKAFDEFFADKPEPIIDLWDTQCLLIRQ